MSPYAPFHHCPTLGDGDLTLYLMVTLLFFWNLRREGCVEVYWVLSLVACEAGGHMGGLLQEKGTFLISIVDSTIMPP